MAPFMPLLSFPTAVHVLASVQETALFTLLDCWIHVAPPSVVRRIPCPTAVQVLASVQETLKREVDGPLDCSVQVAPPSVVLTMIAAP
jgi:hypothetical protein